MVNCSIKDRMPATLSADKIGDELIRIAPAECLVGESDTELVEPYADTMMVTRRPPWSMAHDTAIEKLSRHFGTAGVDGFGALLDLAAPVDELHVGLFGRVVV